MRTLLIVVLSLLPRCPEPWTHQLDLESMLHDAQRLEKLTIMYDSPLEQGFDLLLIRGDGSLTLQKYPGRPTGTTDLPTCKGKVDQAKVKEIVSAVVNRHFWQLPEKRFLEVNGPDHKVLAVQRIFISDGVEKAGRVFGVGTYGEEQESIPDDFAIIERHLKELAQSAFSGKPCQLAPEVQF